MTCFQEGQWFAGFWNLGVLAWSGGVLFATGGIGTVVIQFPPNLDSPLSVRISIASLFP